MQSPQPPANRHRQLLRQRYCCLPHSFIYRGHAAAANDAHVKAGSAKRSDGARILGTFCCPPCCNHEFKLGNSAQSGLPFVLLAAMPPRRSSLSQGLQGINSLPDELLAKCFAPLGQKDR